MGDRMIPDRVEFLLMLARDAQAEGDHMLEEQARANAVHAQRLKDLWAMAEETRRILEKEVRRFQSYLPKEVPEEEKYIRKVEHREQQPKQINSERPAVNPSRTQV